MLLRLNNRCYHCCCCCWLLPILRRLEPGALNVLTRGGSAELMHLNRGCAYPDLEDLFVRADVTADVAPLLAGVPGEIERQLRMMDGPLPDVAIGPHCEAPYACPFKQRCWPERPRHHVSTLYYIGKRKWDLEAQGFATVDQVPDELLPHTIAARQKKAIVENRLIVEPGLADALVRLALECPIYRRPFGCPTGRLVVIFCNT